MFPEYLSLMNPIASSMDRSQILQIVAEVRGLERQGVTICNLTIGDFAPAEFSIPEGFSEQVRRSYVRNETNYPPSSGVQELRESIARLYQRELHIDCDASWVCVASGARPPIYATWRMFVGHGEKSVSFLPAWNIGYYAHLNQSNHHFLSTTQESNFHPTVEQVQSILPETQLIILNTPLNPTGTMIAEDVLRGICEAIVEENKRRKTRPVMMMFDHVYWMLSHDSYKHAVPSVLVPEVAPFVIYIDALSKNFTGTGLRVGWSVLHPSIQPKMATYLAHMGAWASRPEQHATAWLLQEESRYLQYRIDLRRGVKERLDTLYNAISKMQKKGLPISAIPPQGAIYLSVRFDLIGKGFQSNEEIRIWILQKARVAIVPFQAFDMPEDSGWFRLSVGTSSVPELQAAMGRIEILLTKGE
ncbi:MAG: aminotransferase [Deltaproteobacteria bacterium]|nr:aminotransferase [Deltaproteobacteria bacterium]